jgi:hypothetical protein
MAGKKVVRSLSGDLDEDAEEMFLKSDSFRGYSRMAKLGLLGKGQAAAVRRLSNRLRGLARAVVDFNIANHELWAALDRTDKGGTS